MYQPPERIRHRLPVAQSPAIDLANRSLLFSPQALPSGLVVHTRTWVPAMVPWRASADGEVTGDVLDWYRRFAHGRPGVIVVEATGVRDIASGPLLRIGHDRYLPGLRKLVEAVREASGGETRLLIQLIDFLKIRRRPERERYLSSFLAIDAALGDRLNRLLLGRQLAPLDDEYAIRASLIGLDDAQLKSVLSVRQWEAMAFGERERIGDLDRPHIRQLPQTLPPAFASAAVRAKAAGFDGVELHYAHAYTMSSFLSSLNQRPDGYGATQEGRLRLPLEVYQAVRQAVGPSFTVGCRFLVREVVAGGYGAETAANYGLAFAEAGMDFLSLSTGGKFEDAKQPKVGQAAYPYTGRSGWECMPTVYADERGPFGRNVEHQATVRHRLRREGLQTPVVVCGGIQNFDQAEGYLKDGSCDFVGAARQTLADPDWFAKIRRGDGAQVRRCQYTNYCEAIDQLHQPVTCRLWDRMPIGSEENVGKFKGRRLTAPYGSDSSDKGAPSVATESAATK